MEWIKKYLITENPYRVLGVYVGDSIAKVVSNCHRIAAYSKVGQQAGFSLKGDDVLPPLMRDEEMAQQAMQALSLPAEQVKYALFWYADEKFAWASVLNGAIDALLSCDIANALVYYEKLIREDALRSGFLEAVTSDIYAPGEDELAAMLVDAMSDYIQSVGVESLVNNYSQDAKKLNYLFYEKEVSVQLDLLIMELQRPRGDLDFYQLIEDQKSNVGEIMLYMDFAASVFDKSGHRYLAIVERVASAIYRRSRSIVAKVEGWIIQPSSFHAAKACVCILDEVSQYVSESVKELGLNDFSRKIIYRDIDEFEKELNRQRVIVGDRLKESRGAFVRRGVVWAVLCFILIMLFFNRGMIYF